MFQYMKIKRQSTEWKTKDELSSKRPKTDQPGDNFMASVFWNVHRIIFVEYLAKIKIVYRIL